MKKRTLFIFTALSFLLLPALLLFSDGPNYAIAVSGRLRVRSEPNLKGSLVGYLEDGDVVEVVDRSPEPASIGNMRAHWYLIETPSLSGWTYGYYLSFDSQYFPESTTTVYIGWSMDDPLQTTYFAVSPYGERLFSSYEAVIVFSPSGYYYLNRGRQDVVGGLAIVETLSGQTIIDELYTEEDPYWEGDNLRYWAVTDRLDNGEIAVELVEFSDGRVTRGDSIEGPGGEYLGPAGPIGPDPLENESWSRWTLVESATPGERFFQPRAVIHEHVLNVVFLGLVPANHSGDFDVFIYEWTETSPLHRIDTYTSAASATLPAYGIEPGLGLLDEYDVWRQGDNYIVSGGVLYYRINRSRPALHTGYYRYELQSRKPPEKIEKSTFDIHATSYSLDDFQHLSLAPNDERIAFCSVYDIQVFHNPGDFASLKGNRVSGFYIESAPEDFALSSFFYDFEETADSDSLVIGAISWDYTGRYLYFDNSGLDFRCIWRMDTLDRAVEKIVPEHEAIHPWYVEWYGNVCVVYTEDGSLKVATESWDGGP